MVRRRAGLTAVAGLAVPLVVLLASPAAASPQGGAASGTVTVPTLTDAWYSSSSACTASPTGCLPAAAPVSPYPAKTLHVGVGAGQEESRTYLSLNLLALPAGTALTGGTLRLPVAGPEDGTRAADTATLQACLVTGTFKDDVEGSTAQPPAIDCTQAAAPAKYVAAAGTAPAQLTVDLAAFAAAWAGGSTGQALALVPAADTAPASAWHIALSAHDRTGSTVSAPSAAVSYASSAAAADPSYSAPPVTGDAAAGTGSSAVSFGAAPLAPQPATVATGPVPVTQPTVAAQAAPQALPQLQPQALVGTGRFAYPGVFLLPILLAVVGGFLARAMTRDLVPVS